MSEFRGSRRLMARLSEARRVKQTNRSATRQQVSPDENALKRRLNTEAGMPWRSTGCALVKQAPKTVA